MALSGSVALSWPLVLELEGLILFTYPLPHPPSLATLRKPLLLGGGRRKSAAVSWAKGQTLRVAFAKIVSYGFRGLVFKRKHQAIGLNV